MQPGWRGFYFNGLTAARQTVDVAITFDGVRITFQDGTHKDWRITEIRQPQGAFSGDRRRLEYGSDPAESLVVDDDTFAIALRSAFPERKLRGSETLRTRRLVLWGMATLVAAVVGFAVFAGPAAGWIAAQVPPEWETRLGDNVGESMAPADQRCIDSTALTALRSILDRLTAAEPSPYAYRLVVVRDSMVNAFAAPGGFVAIYSGLLEAAATPEEVAGVLAHEIQHVVQRHALQASIRETPIRIGISVLFGSGGGGEAIASLAGSIGALRYRRADELSADRAGRRTLERANVDARGMASFMRTLERREKGAAGVLSYLSTHPATRDRIRVLESLDSSGQGEVRPVLDSATWGQVRRACSR